MQLSLISSALPFCQLKTFELDEYGDILPATYSKVMTHEDEQSILVISYDQWIRLIEDKDGWVLHSTKEKDDETVISCSILPDDTVLVAIYEAFQFYSSDLDLLSVVALNSIVDGLAGRDRWGDD